MSHTEEVGPWKPIFGVTPYVRWGDGEGAGPMEVKCFVGPQHPCSKDATRATTHFGYCRVYDHTVGLSVSTVTHSGKGSVYKG